MHLFEVTDTEGKKISLHAYYVICIKEKENSATIVLSKNEEFLKFETKETYEEVMKRYNDVMSTETKI